MALMCNKLVMHVSRECRDRVLKRLGFDGENIHLSSLISLPDAVAQGSDIELFQWKETKWGTQQEVLKAQYEGSILKVYSDGLILPAVKLLCFIFPLYSMTFCYSSDMAMLDVGRMSFYNRNCVLETVHRDFAFACAVWDVDLLNAIVMQEQGTSSMSFTQLDILKTWGSKDDLRNSDEFNSYDLLHL